MKHLITAAVILFATALPLAAQNAPNKPVDPTTDYTAMDAEKFEKSILDIGDGVSLIYDIDQGDLTGKEAKGLVQRMIPILRRRIDPANMANIKMIPRGDTRIEIQLPLTDQTNPNATAQPATDYTAMTEDQFKWAVLGILSNHPEILTANKKTITPADLETYENKIISKVQSFYGTALTLLLVFIALFTIILSLILEGIRQSSFKKKMAEKEKELQEYTNGEIEKAEKKLKDHHAEVLEGLKVDISSKLAMAFSGIAGACHGLGFSNPAVICGFLSVRENLYAKKYESAIKTLNLVVKDIGSFGEEFSKETLEKIERGIRKIQKNIDLSEHPEIIVLLEDTVRLASYYLVQLEKKPPPTEPTT